MIRLVPRAFAFTVLFLLLGFSALSHAQEVTVRYYISAVLLPDQDKDYQRLALDDANPRPLAFSNEIVTLPNGKAAFSWGISYVKAIDWSGIDADPRNIRLFAGAEGSPKNQAELLNTLSTTRWDAAKVSDTQRQKMRNICIDLGVSVVDISPSISLRQILRKVGTFLKPDFDESKFSAN